MHEDVLSRIEELKIEWAGEGKEVLFDESIQIFD
jgi:hypothetical protein